MNVPCAEDPELWFAEAEYLRRQAKAKCGTCPVQRACLERGKLEDWGIWGGLDVSERGRIFPRVA